MKMKVCYLCLNANPFFPSWSYQENCLPEQNVKDGHEAVVIACKRIEKEFKKFAETEKYMNDDIALLENGVKLYRVKDKYKLPSVINRRIGSHRGVYEIICREKPDVIFVHDPQGKDTDSAVRYKKKNPDVRLYVESHADYNNSAHFLLTEKILNRGIYKRRIRKNLPYFDRFFYVSRESGEFTKDLYGVPEQLMEFYPLGGYIVESDERENIRTKFREKYKLIEDNIVMVHSGKMDGKKRTLDILEAFEKVQDSRFRLFIIGSFTEDVEKKVMPIINNDSRILYLGWKSSDELHEYLCAADIYLQPGSQSATMQNALCCGCPVMLFPYKSHEVYVKNNGFFVENAQDIQDAFEEIADKPECLKAMSEASYVIARDLLDYRKLAARLYE